MIHMVISGNLTGFSHFYASPQAKSLLSEAPFDFDYRNYLTFLNGGEKAYALSFAPRVLAMSVVTRILDSFRRPGVLVVTLLVPRGEQVVPASGQSPDAAYRLLNELFERFMERCFVNGMLNQNSAVLMQDYYADIVGRYALAPDGRQRAVNTAINVSTNIKRSGYVQTAENNVPLYLATPWRSSYEGFHHVFLAQNPKDNLIDEQPEEVMLYRVTVSNTGQSIPAVRLTDRIPQIMPGEGEKDIPSKDFTYQQVLNGEARGIVARLQNETLELTYRFEEEKKEIVFRFMHDGQKVKFECVMPRLRFADDSEMPLTNEKWLFLGAEINATVSVLISKPTYQVEGGTVDLRRLKNGDVCTLQLVERQKSKQRPIPAVTGHTGTATTTRTGTDHIARTGTDPSTRTGTGSTGGTTQNSTSQNSTSQNSTSQNSTTQNSTTQNSASRTTITVQPGPNPAPTPKPRPNDFNMKVAGILGCVCVAAYMLVASFTHWWPFADSLSSGGDDPVVTDSAITKKVVVSFVDASGDELTSKSVVHKYFDNGSMKCFVAPDTAQRKVGFDSSKLAYTYNLTGQKDQEFVFSVAVDGVNVCSEERSLSDIDSGLVLKLQVKASDVKTYFEIKSKIDFYSKNGWALGNEYSNQKSLAEKMSDSELKTRILDMLKSANKLSAHREADTSDPNQKSSKQSGNKTRDTQKPESKKQNHDKLGDKLPEGSAKLIQNGSGFNTKTPGLTEAQKKVLNAYNALKEEQRKQCVGATTYKGLQEKVSKVQKNSTLQQQ